MTDWTEESRSATDWTGEGAVVATAVRDAWSIGTWGWMQDGGATLGNAPSVALWGWAYGEFGIGWSEEARSSTPWTEEAR